MNPHQATRWVYRGLFGATLILVALAVRSFDLMSVAEDDYSTPDYPPGTRLIVRPVAQDDGEWWVGSLYFAAYVWPPDGDQLAPRLVRLVGVPGEPVEVSERQVRVGGRLVSVPPDVARAWPGTVPAGHCLLLTDQPDVLPPRELHPDSRDLGPVPLDGLLFRVVASVGF